MHAQVGVQWLRTHAAVDMEAAAADAAREVELHRLAQIIGYAVDAELVGLEDDMTAPATYLRIGQRQRAVVDADVRDAPVPRGWRFRLAGGWRGLEQIGEVDAA